MVEVSMTAKNGTAERSMPSRAIDWLGLRSVYQPLRMRFNIVVERRRLRAASRSSPLRIVVGSSGISQDGWVATESTYLDLLKRDDWENYFSTHKIDAILAEHVWEHLTPEQGLLAAINCARYLRPGGYLRLAVPDGNHPDPAYIDYVKPGGGGYGADDHKVLYTYKTLTKMLSDAGLSVRLLEYFDDERKFVANPWVPEQGMIHRSSQFDERNRGGKLKYTSIIVDAFRP
jgi:predicted SAM-dependent methyltransferase